MASWIWGSSLNPQLEDLVEKACSPLNLPWPESEDIALNLEICDLIRSKTVPPKSAMQSLKTRLASKNGRVQMAALGLTDTCIKNGGDHFLQEIASKDFVGEMTNLIKAPVREMAINLLQQWALVFETKSNLSYLPEIYRDLKASGIAFPPPPKTVSNHLLTTATPPTWIDSESCMRCRSPFTFTNRKHHCRNCGLVFDQACSSKTMPLPHLGIVQEVRVCEPCYQKGGRGERLSKNDPNTPSIPAKRSIRTEQFDADLQRAIALSLAEGSSGEASNQMVGSQPGMHGRKLEGSDVLETEDDELRLAIEASLADMHQVRPSAPGAIEDPEIDYKPLPTYDLSPRETETMLTFAQTIEHAVGFGDRDLQRFPHVYPLYEQAHGLAGKLQRNVEEKGTKHYMLAEMHEQLMQAVRRYDQLQEEQEAYSIRQRMTQSQHQPGAHRAGAPAVSEYMGYSTISQQPSYHSPVPSIRTGIHQQHPPGQPPYIHQSTQIPTVGLPYSDRAGSLDYQARPMHTQATESFASDYRQERPYLDPTYQSHPVTQPPPSLPTHTYQSEAYVPVPIAQTGSSAHPNGGAQDEPWTMRAPPHTVEETFPAMPDAPNHALPRIDRQPARRTEDAEEPLLIEL